MDMIHFFCWFLPYLSFLDFPGVQPVNVYRPREALGANFMSNLEPLQVKEYWERNLEDHDNDKELEHILSRQILAQSYASDG
jgi:hypothetical protein